MRRSIALLFALGLVSLSVPAHATVKFPWYIGENLDLEEDPECTLCHKNNDGGKGTVIRPFGISMQVLGLNKKSTRGDMDAFLASMDSLSIDSDGDGASDLDELRSGENPNVNPDGTSSGFTDYPIPETGCSVVRAVPSGGACDVFASVVFAFAVAILRRQRQRK